MKMKESQFLLIKEQLKKLTSKECFYKQKLEGINVDQIQSQEDFEKLPFTWKGDLREAYPLGLMAAPEEEIVRIHSSSGTTGTPVIIPYTQRDVDDWAWMFARCYEMAGITNMDRIQITPGYGLWTAGIGFQLGAERLGAMTVPMGPGNTDKQLRMMMDMKYTVLVRNLILRPASCRGDRQERNRGEDLPEKGCDRFRALGRENEKKDRLRAGSGSLRYLRPDRGLWAWYCHQLSEAGGHALLG